MKFFSLIVFIFVFSTPIVSQETSIAQRLDVELSSFYYREFDNLFGAYHEELTISPSFSVNINKRFYLGLRSYIVRGRSKISPIFSDWHTLIGPTMRYHLVKKSRLELNIEGGYFFGDYCPGCFPNDENFKASLHYIGVAMDFNLQLLKTIPSLWFKLSFATNNAINVKSLGGYNLPLIGVQYKFGRNN